MLISKSKIGIAERVPNFANEKYAAQKFLKEYFFILEQLEIDTSFNSTVDYLMFNELLKRMGFVNSEEEVETQISINERALIHDAYQLL